MGSGAAYEYYTANPTNSLSVAGVFSGRSGSRIQPFTEFTTGGQDGRQGDSSGQAKQIIGSGRTYAYKTWTSAVVFDQFGGPGKAAHIGVQSYAYSYPSCTQVGTAKDPSRDCKNGTQTSWFNPTFTGALVSISSTTYKGSLTIARYTAKITNGSTGTATKVSSGTYTFLDRINGTSRTITTTWKLGTASPVTEHLTASYSNPKVLTVKSTH